MGFFDIIWSALWIFLLIAWFWVVISVISDIFRSRDMGGFHKALWILLVIWIPWLGVLAYIFVRGDKMNQHRLEYASRIDEANRDYIKSLYGPNSTADELEKLAALKEKGVLSDDEFNTQKTKLLGMEQKS
jgi:hypothetical protein